MKQEFQLFYLPIPINRTGTDWPTGTNDFKNILGKH